MAAAHGAPISWRISPHAARMWRQQRNGAKKKKAKLKSEAWRK